MATPWVKHYNDLCPERATHKIIIKGSPLCSALTVIIFFYIYPGHCSNAVDLGDFRKRIYQDRIPPLRGGINGIRRHLGLLYKYLK